MEAFAATPKSSCTSRSTRKSPRLGRPAPGLAQQRGRFHDGVLGEKVEEADGVEEVGLAGSVMACEAVERPQAHVHVEKVLEALDVESRQHLAASERRGFYARRGGSRRQSPPGRLVYFSRFYASLPLSRIVRPPHLLLGGGWPVPARRRPAPAGARCGLRDLGPFDPPSGGGGVHRRLARHGGRGARRGARHPARHAGGALDLDAAGVHRHAVGEDAGRRLRRAVGGGGGVGRLLPPDGRRRRGDGAGDEHRGGAPGGRPGGDDRRHDGEEDRSRRGAAGTPPSPSRRSWPAAPSPPTRRSPRT